MKVFTYGTLKSGYWNNGRLNGATLIGPDIVKGFKLYDAGFPYAITSPDTYILGEVWDLGEGDKSLEILERLDYLEGYHGPNQQNHYDRRLVSTISGTEASIYFRDKLRGRQLPECPCIESNGLTVYEWSA